MQLSFLLLFFLHVLVAASQKSPLNIQRGPLVLGETSPKFVEAKAATNRP